ncbi:MAG: AAA family ATPase [Nitrospirae bacterium]|nr:AAA family ATPase [Nitrospirota bacterium]
MRRPLDRLTINGFKSIRELNNFGLRNLNVIIGGNGAGKSNFVELFRVISAMMKSDGLKEYVAGNADSYLLGGPKQTKAIAVKLVFGQNGYDFELAPTQEGFFLINNEQRHYFPYRQTRNLGSGNFNHGLLTDKNNKEMASWYTYNAICSRSSICCRGVVGTIRPWLNITKPI